MRLTIDFSPLVVDLGKLTDAARRRLPAELELGALEGALLVQGELMQSLPRGAGGVGGGAGLAGSISYDLQRSESGVLASIGTPLPYAEHVEYGTRPHRPPVQPIQDWVEIKLGVSGERARGVAFAIAQRIAVRGTRAQPVWEPVFTRTQPQLRERVAAAVQRATEGLL